MGSGDVREQQFLESYNATNSDRVSTVSEPFNDYPLGGSTPGGTQKADRDPLSSYLLSG
jgi:hypothetical protein